MLRSLSSGVSGLRNHQVRMDVIANNIANVNTTAFKASRASFSEIFSQLIRTESINPAQVGSGMGINTIDLLFNQGAPAVTGRALDLAVDGNGFFRLAKYSDDGISDYYYTRDGAFYVDDQGYLVSATGLYVLGIDVLDEDDITAVLNRTYSIEDGFPGERIRIYDPNGEDGDKEIGLMTLRIDGNGLVFVNGRMDRGSMILLDNYSNPENLTKLGSNLYQTPLYGDEGLPLEKGWGVPGGTGGQGKLLSGALEMSNVDLSTEFSNMITTQRGYQANARVITVSDDMLRELIDLKR